MCYPSNGDPKVSAPATAEIDRYVRVATDVLPAAGKRAATSVFSCSMGVSAPWGSIKTATGVPMGWRCDGPPGFDRPFDRIYIAALRPTATGERKPAAALGGADVPLVTHTRVAIVPKGEVFSGWPRTR